MIAPDDASAPAISSAPASRRGQPAGGIRTHPASGLRWLPVAAAAIVAQVAVIYLIGRSGEGQRWLPVLLPSAHLLLVTFLVRNLAFRGIRLVLAGLTLNLIVMGLNGGLMPVAPESMEAIGKHDVQELNLGDPIPGTKNVLLEKDETRARWLSDTILLPVPRPYRRAVSVGDLAVFVGVVITFVEVAGRFGRSKASGAGRNTHGTRLQR